MQEVTTAIIIPCHNEAANLAETCHSLGFGISKETCPEDTLLVLVNNASTDATEQVCKEVKDNSPLGKVIIYNEPTRGFIPARTAGITAVRSYAEVMHVPSSEILIIQADADTIYGPGYIEHLSSAARKHGAGALFESESLLPRDVLDVYPSYFNLVKVTDASLEQYFASSEYDVIVDDKTAAYYLSDYEKWGGHTREYTENDDEVHNGTSRLFIKARLHGASRIHVDEAQAFHSIRRTIENPAYMFATAGITRSPSWKQNWNSTYKGPNSPELFAQEMHTPEVQRALQMRKAHVLSLFTFLPYIITRALGEEDTIKLSPALTPLMNALPLRSKEELINNSALAFQDIFTLIDTHFDTMLESF